MPEMRARHRLPALLVAAILVVAASPSAAADPTPEEAEAFLEAAEAKLGELAVTASRASWVQSNFITFDTNVLAAETGAAITAAAVEAATGAARFHDLDLPDALSRKILILRTGLPAPAPLDPAKNREVADLAAELSAMYGAGRYCPDGKTGDDCYDLEELETILDGSRDPAELLMAWQGWRTVSVSMRPKFQRFVELINEGANELGFADAGALWRSAYDMEPEAFAAELDRLWGQVKPLYEALHCHVRAKLHERYGDAVVPAEGPIPAHLLGNMWAQSWSNVYDLVAPTDADPGYDLTARLLAKGLDAREMVRYGERFFTSLGFAPLPDTFWDRSLFTKPRDRDVVCHASAWDIDNEDDLRIKMCIEVNAEDFRTIHHELGHNFYQRAYNQQPFLFRNSANDGFHEAIGDTIALSVTPAYLVEVGLLDSEPPPDKDLGLLMNEALDKVAFLPFGLLIDRWRWQVFDGELRPDRYNEGWWELRRRYQGVAPPIPRREADFDPGAKFHVPANVPYTRYFLAHILEFQLHRSLCQMAGYEGPLNRCSIYGNQEAGEALGAMLELGQSRPWPEALAMVTGQEEMDASAILDYFAPLQRWLEEQNEGRRCGW